MPGAGLAFTTGVAGVTTTFFSVLVVLLVVVPGGVRYVAVRVLLTVVVSFAFLELEQAKKEVKNML
jgi:hypothetical protein